MAMNLSLLIHETPKGELSTSHPVIDVLREGIPSVKSCKNLVSGHPLEAQFGEKGFQNHWESRLQRNALCFGHGASRGLARQMEIVSQVRRLPSMSSGTNLGKEILSGKDTEIEMDDWVGWERPMSFASPALMDMHSVIERSLGW